MKLFKGLKTLLVNQKILFYWFLLILMVPNICLCFTEPWSAMAKLTQVLLPLSVYYWLMSTLFKNCGKTLWVLFPLVFLAAFQTVLLYLFGQSIIAVDMFLNLVTTNPTEALELLDKLLPAIVIVVLLYVPALIVAIISIWKKGQCPVSFLRRERRRSLWLFGAGILALLTTYLTDSRYDPKTDLYPLNVCYNVQLAVQRDAQVRHYHETAQHFKFHSHPTHPLSQREVYVMVVGETSRALNWQLYGYPRATNPELSNIEGLTAFTHVLSESNTTHKSVPMLLSAVAASNFDSIYNQKSILTAFKEAGYATAFFSNQRYNHSFIDFFGQEADRVEFVKEAHSQVDTNPSDNDLLVLVREELSKGADKLFIVLHTYGSHFNYRERYPVDMAHFKPDTPVDAKVRYRSNLINAYDNSIRNTDRFLAQLIALLDRQSCHAAMLYTSDHGEDLFDDDRHLFLHASPVPSYYQIHVPFLLWTSTSYRTDYSAIAHVAEQQKEKQISASASFFPTMLQIAGIQTKFCNDTLSVVNPLFKEKPRWYLDDHNRARRLTDTGLETPDFEMLQKAGITY